MNRMRMRTKLMLAFGLISIISVSILTAVNIAQNTEHYKTNAGHYQGQVLRQLQTNVERDIESLEELMLYLSINPTISDYFGQGQHMPVRQYLDTIYEMETLLSSMLSQNTMLASVYLFPANWTDTVSVTRRSAVAFTGDIYQSDWYASLQSGAPLPRFLHQAEGQVVSYNLTRRVYNLQTRGWIGTIVVGYDIQQLSALAHVYETDGRTALWVQDGETVAYAPSHADAGPVPINDHDRLISAVHSDQLGWTFTIAQPLTEVYRGIADTIRLALMICALTLALTILVSLVFARSIASPIAKLQTHMESVTEGDFSARLQTSREDEIGSIIRAFNVMAEEIDTLITNVYRAKLQQKESEVRALQAQINPHFLFNTLESIHMLAVLNDDDEVSAAITVLGQHLRYSVDWSRRFVPLRDELSHLLRYVSIFNLKHQMFRVEQAVEEGLLDLLVFKMSLQPIVENSIRHGLKGVRNGLVCIRAYREQDDLIIRISDNGKGISPERLAVLRTLLEGDGEAAEIGIGLKNIHQRIRLYFGRTYGLTLDAPPAGGLTVTVRIAATWEPPTAREEHGHDL